jgi:hypothetical protein
MGNFHAGYIRVSRRVIDDAGSISRCRKNVGILAGTTTNTQCLKNKLTPIYTSFGQMTRKGSIK